MNPFIAVLFQIIPLAMGVFTLALGLLILATGEMPPSFVAGHVLVFLTSICVALFCTAATIIRLLTKHSSPFWLVAMPLLGYAVGLGTSGYGIWLFYDVLSPEHIIAGHIVFGLGLISCCVATVATASVKFTLIPRNSAGRPGEIPAEAFSTGVGRLLVAVPVICTLAALGVAGISYRDGDPMTYLTVSCVLGGIGLVCASLIGLVASVVRQVRNTYSDKDRCLWPGLALVTGSINILAGLAVLFFVQGTVRFAPGFVLIGLGIVCYSILSKVLLLALVWRRSFPLANRIPLIPVCTALVSLFIAVFLFQEAQAQSALFIPARVVAGLGAICFTLFSIVSILESGTSTGEK